MQLKELVRYGKEGECMERAGGCDGREDGTYEAGRGGWRFGCG